MKCNEDFMVLNDAHEAAGSEVAAVQEELAKANEDLAHYKNTVESALADKSKAVENAQIWSSQIDFYKNKARKDEALRRKLHNSVMELKGNIRVYCRVRPYLPSEKPSAAKKGEKAIEYSNSLILMLSNEALLM